MTEDQGRTSVQVDAYISGIKDGARSLADELGRATLLLDRYRIREQTVAQLIDLVLSHPSDSYGRNDNDHRMRVLASELKKQRME